MRAGLPHPDPSPSRRASRPGKGVRGLSFPSSALPPLLPGFLPVLPPFRVLLILLLLIAPRSPGGWCTSPSWCTRLRGVPTDRSIVFGALASLAWCTLAPVSRLGAVFQAWYTRMSGHCSLTAFAYPPVRAGAERASAEIEAFAGRGWPNSVGCGVPRPPNHPCASRGPQLCHMRGPTQQEPKRAERSPRGPQQGPKWTPRGPRCDDDDDDCDDDDDGVDGDGWSW